MKQTILYMSVIMIISVVTFSHVFAFEGNDDNVTRDYYVQLYQSQQYVSDFKQVFKTENDKRDYRELRKYINHKEEILRILKMAGDEYYYGLSYSKLFSIDYVQNLEDELKFRKPGDKILLRLNSVRPSFDYSGEYAAQYVETEILPRIKTRFEEAAQRDSLNQIAYMLIQKNIEILSLDIFQAEQAIYLSLSPEFRNQDFRIWISLTFSGLIAVLLLAFFLIIFKRSDISLSKQLLSSSGLQFITVFILIIAIILFGILNVLGGSELAAILSGISGYILGKGGSEAAGVAREEKHKKDFAQVKQHLPNHIAEEPSAILPIQDGSEENMEFTDIQEENYFPEEFTENSY